MGRQMFQEPDDSGANLAQPMALGDPEDEPCKAWVWHQETEPPWIPRPQTSTRTSWKVLELCSEFIRGKVEVWIHRPDWV